MRKISKARFEALSYARMPMVKILSDEVDWYSSNNNSILGVILRDRTDDDFVAVVLGRDEAGVFRWIDGKASIVSIDAARKQIIETILQHSKGGANEFPQGVITRKKNAIFEQVVKEDAMLEDYKLLSESEYFSPAKELVQEIAYSFEDPDGNYIQQFQSDGFNARMWELYLYAFFHEMNFEIKRDFNAPDYVVEKVGQRVCVEAVTVNPSQANFDEPEPKDNEAIAELLKDYMPIKFGGPLYDKLKKKYWEKPHVAGNPLVLAIHDYHQKDSMMWSRKGLEAYLYGAVRTSEFSPEAGLVENVELINEHRWKGKVIPSGFYTQPDSEHVSAVIHSNQSTIGKFLRMGYLAEFGRQDLNIRFVGQAIYGNNGIQVDFDSSIDAEGYEEYWKNSVTIYHNPNALHPLELDLFPGVSQVWFEDGKFESIKPAFYPVYGRTYYREKEV
ncbi:MAG: hypothetical protein DRR42_01615 [Gammaproteobacteria bacterium]|nr:MAG: hypothetical protein DRR42_01615 [Gammaproteobacteria bacterium]